MHSDSQSLAGRLAYLGSGIPDLAATFIYREIFELERQGYKVQIYSIWRPDPKKLSAEALPLCEQTYYLQPVRMTALIGAHCYYFLRQPLRYLSTLWKMLSPLHHRPKDRFRSLLHFGEAPVLARRMELDKITHIHSHYASQPTSVARVVYLLTGIPYSFSAHAHDIWADRLLLREKLAEARFVACCSDCGRSELARQGDPDAAEKVHLIYHGIDVRRFSPPENRPEPNNLILSVGRFESVKGYPILVRACKILKDAGIPFRCCIVGDGDEKDLVASLVKEYRLEDCFELPGAVRQEKILSYYHRAAVFTLPCIPAADGRHDGVPNVLVEAMATGLPVVSTRIGGVPELIEHGRDGFTITPGNIEELANQLKELLQNASLRERIGSTARTKIERHFDNRKTIEPLLRLFRMKAGIDGSIDKSMASQEKPGLALAV
jgi:glycosyltransferase involved in cell wall biosynthesis